MELSGQLHTLTTSHPGKEPRHPLNRRLLGMLQSQYGHLEQQENVMTLPGNCG
jgi:hypothetical protein